MKLEVEIDKKYFLIISCLILVGIFSIIAISATQPQAYVEGGQGLVSHAASDISGSINADTIDGMHASDLIGASGSGTNYVQTFYGIDACPTGWQTAVNGVAQGVYLNSASTGHQIKATTAADLAVCTGKERIYAAQWSTEIGRIISTTHSDNWHWGTYLYDWGVSDSLYIQCVVCYR